MSEADFVIVGAGSAGCVLAQRLSEHARHSVMVLEAGASDWRPSVQMPIGYGMTYFDPTVNWKYLTEPVPALGGRTSYWPRGKVLGGSSAINAMVFVRGHPGDDAVGYCLRALRAHPRCRFGEDELPRLSLGLARKVGDDPPFLGGTQ